MYAIKFCARVDIFLIYMCQKEFFLYGISHFFRCCSSLFASSSLLGCTSKKQFFCHKYSNFRLVFFLCCVSTIHFIAFNCATHFNEFPIQVRHLLLVIGLYLMLENERRGESRTFARIYSNGNFNLDHSPSLIFYMTIE